MQVNPSETRGALSIAACNSGKSFAERIIRELNIIARNEADEHRYDLHNVEEVVFPNGEVKVVIHEFIRGDDFYIIQCMDDPLSERTINDNLMALITAIHAAYQSDPDHITAVIPQFPYSRQERRKTREAISAKIVAQLIENAGAQRVLTLDIHAEAIQGFFNYTKLEDMHASGEMVDCVLNKLKLDLSKLIVTGPDVGSAEKARHYSKKLGVNFAIVDKARDYSKPGQVESMRLVGDVRGKNILIVDDMIATGGTLLHAAKLLKDNGAEDIYVAVSLPFFNGDAVERIEKAYQEGLIKLIIGTDAVFWGESFVRNTEWYAEVSVAPLFARVIYNINKKRSVSQLLR
ncbi:MAG: ribose-phosphate pyrophosphokinase [Calditrichaeota bacterium]|nr:ribose-phosphate pyrophosphokinase [Calditrichota bacterium]RQV92470.1 MAG: ribose-phosphate pyrophosphokinase [bacterium]RQV99000.1 MAG: ribose-phosphate pyrophosphokinase [Calditrichota bacterium]